MHRAGKRTRLHKTVEFSAQKVSCASTQLHGRDTDMERTDRNIVTAACETSQADLQGVLPLNLGVNPMHVGREWRALHGTNAGDNSPSHLKIWEDASIGRDYRTVDALTKGILATSRVL